MLNYIQSSGTQYIDTGFVPTGENFKIDLIFDQTKQTGSNSLFGSEINNSTLSSNGRQWSIVSFRGSTNTYQSHWVGTTSNSNHIDTSLNTIYNLSLHANNGTLTIVKDKIYITTSTIDGSLLKSLNIFIFANHIDGKVGQYSYMKLYSFRMYDNDVLVRNFVPCINESGQYGLYDYVTNQFYGNSGTGSFTGA